MPVPQAEGLDFRTLLALRAARGELDQVRRAVEPRHELPALMAQCERQRRVGRFDSVRGARLPLVGGLLNSVQALGWALGVPPGAAFDDDALLARLDAAMARRIAPRELAHGPCQQVVLRGDAVDLGLLPVPTVFELDSGPFITGACGIARHPDTGELNVGIYRTLVLGPDRLVVSASRNSDLHRIYAAHERSGRPLDIALAIGAEPALLMAAVCRLPSSESEYGLAGGLLGRALNLVRAQTSDLLLPANAEIVIEARVDFGQRVDNTLGEFAGLYGTDSAPAAQVRAIGHRRDAICHAILAGRHAEHTTLGSIATAGIRRSIADALRAQLPPLAGLHVYLEPALGSMAHVVLALDKRHDDEPHALLDAAFAAQLPGPAGPMPASRLVKRVIVVDPDVDVHDLADVEWALWIRTARAAHFRVQADVPSWDLERCADPARGSLRVAVDATMALADRARLRRTVIPGAAALRLADYLVAPLDTPPAAG